MKKTEEVEAFDSPARVRPEHMVINPDAPVRLQLFAIRDMTPLGVAFKGEKLDNSGRHGMTGDDRYRAGCIYRAIWDTVNAPMGGGGGLKERVNSSPVAGGPDNKLYARQMFKMIEERLSQNCRFILRMFIGEGSTASDAVRNRLALSRNEVWFSICLYLDELCDVVGLLGLGDSQFAPGAHEEKRSQVA
jgi:hypothetical protein